MPGPAFCAAVAVSTKMPVPMTAPMPSRVSWTTPSDRLSDFFSAVARIASSDLMRHIVPPPSRRPKRHLWLKDEAGLVFNLGSSMKLAARVRLG